MCRWYYKCRDAGYTPGDDGCRFYLWELVWRAAKVFGGKATIEDQLANMQDVVSQLQIIYNAVRGQGARRV